VGGHPQKRTATCARNSCASKSRRGAKKAILAVASSMLTAAYFMLRDGVEHHDLGSHHFEQRDKEQLAKRLLQRLRDLGVAVEVKVA
jgi:transposase